MGTGTLELPVLPFTNKVVNDMYFDVQKYPSDVDLEFDARGMLAKGNHKLGQITNFSLPPGVTCPSATKACLEKCYAIRYVRRLPKVRDFYTRNLGRAARRDFVPQMIEALQALQVPVLRLHVSGDFYSSKYLEKWIRIATRCPDTLIFCYTRAWRFAKMRPTLARFAKLPNVKLWFSFDRDSMDVWRSDDIRPHVRLAFMEMPDDQTTPNYADLVFRVSRNSRRVKSNGVLVCPVENGTAAGKRMTCASCRFCFDTAFKRASS